MFTGVPASVPEAEQELDRAGAALLTAVLPQGYCAAERVARFGSADVRRRVNRELGPGASGSSVSAVGFDLRRKRQERSIAGCNNGREFASEVVDEDLRPGVA